MIAWFRYARHEDVPTLVASGLWAVIANLGLPHSNYSVLMQWCGEGEPASAGDARRAATTGAACEHATHDSGGRP